MSATRRSLSERYAGVRLCKQRFITSTIQNLLGDMCLTAQCTTSESKYDMISQFGNKTTLTSIVKEHACYKVAVVGGGCYRT